MAVRFDASTEFWRRAAPADVLDYNSPYTWMAHVYPGLDLNAVASLVSLHNNTVDNRDYLRTLSTGNSWQLRVDTAGVGSNVTGNTIVYGAWCHMALVRESTISLKLYVDGALVATNTSSVIARTAATQFDIAIFRSAGPWDGRVYAMKAWSAALTQAEIDQERQTVIPRRLANLYGWWPIRPGSAERVKDYSGFARHWTENGTPTDEDAPTVAWGGAAPPPRRPWRVYPRR